PPMSAGHTDYDYAVVRVVPCVHRGEFANVGVVLHARRARFLGARLRRDPEWLAARCPGLDVEVLGRYLDAYERVAAGGPEGGPVGLLPPSERFHWLTAPRSAALQTSPVHTGRTDDPAATLERLFETHVA
ncbi:MAG: DUF3037 domain-containing protein, partial [Rhodothermales bacterium]|nr:DUF3037 domain-containing protein [Rhodothermales bacterium]